MHVRLADESVCIGPPPAKDSYLNIPALLAACEITGADAVHPGYGFLSENARFAEILAEHSIALHRPEGRAHPPDGRQDRGQAHRQAPRHSRACPAPTAASAPTTKRWRSPREIGFPVLVKAAAGGGGRGMKVAHTEDELADGAVDRPHRSQGRVRRRRGLSREISAASRATSKSRCSATAAATPSISASATARCSAATRRSGRKAPRRRSTPQRATRSARPCAKAMRDLKYLGVGTVEFLYEDGEFYFIEMNTRIQVEHPVTEMITGIDLVLEQIRVAAGGDLPCTQDDVAHQRPRHRVPHQCGEPGDLPALARQDHALPSARRPRRARRFRGLSGLRDPALLRLAGRQADRARQDPQRMPDAAAPRARRDSWSTASRPRCRCSAPWCASPTSSTATTISTGSSSTSPARRRDQGLLSSAS